MKAIKYLFTFILFVLSVGVGAQNLNQLKVEDVIGAAGKDVDIPIALTNTQEIVAVQFDLHLPFAQATSRPVLVPERIDGHTVSVRSLGSNVYTVVIVSLNNQPLKGNSGILLNFPMQVSAAAQADEVYAITITDPVLTLVDGSNVASEGLNGKFTIKRVPTPDLTVENITLSQNQLAPGQEIGVNWTVKNVGKEITGAGWQENIYLLDKQGKPIYIGRTYSEAKLAQQVSLPRSVTLKIPELVGCDGEVAVQVVLVPTPETGELKSDRTNNTVESAQKYVLAKQLSLTVEARRMVEGNSTPTRFQLSRSGSWETAETFCISTANTGRLSVPETVVIPKGQSGVYFYATVVNNEVSNDYLEESLIVQGNNGYTDISKTIEIDDDELLTLRMAADKVDLVEGESFNLTVTRQRTLTEDSVWLSCEKPTRFDFPSMVVFPVGQSSTTVVVRAIDDVLADVDHTVGFYAVATHYTKAEQLVVLKDNDIPDISMDLAPATISEGAGPNAIMATLRRTTATNSKVTIKLSDNSAGRLYSSTRTIVMDKGVTEAQFTIGVVDNAEVEEQQNYDFVAAVYLSSCDCSGSGTDKGIVSKQITILDNDGPSLNLTAATSMVQEGGAEGTDLIVRHNLPSTQEVVVHLNSEDAYLDLPAQVTIPIGQKEVRVPVKARANEVEGDTRTIVVNATSEGFSNGSCWLLISDKTLPDAYIAALSLNNLAPEAESEVVATLQIGNSGVRELPVGTEVAYYLSNESQPLATVLLEETVAPSAVKELNHTLSLPSAIGKHDFYVKINPENKFSECLTVNNTSERVHLNIRPPYEATAIVDKDIVDPLGPVVVHGQLKGNKIANMPVEVYMINEGERKVYATNSDETGKYKVGWMSGAEQIGQFTVGACYPGEKLSKAMDVYNIYGLRRANADYIKCQNLVGIAWESSFVLQNPSQLDLHNLRVEVIEAPKACEMEFNKIPLLAGGEKKALVYRVKGLAETEGTDWEHVKLRVVSDEGANLDLLMYYYCRSPKGKLYAGTNKIETTMIKGKSRDYSIEIRNVGQGPTGAISLSLPENQGWLTAVTPLQMASLEPDEKATIILRFVPTPDMQLNVPVTGKIGVNCENGEGLPLSFRIETVSDQTGTLLVDVCDENTYYTESAPHLAGAQIVVKHPTTGALITQGVSDENGHYQVELPEGYYSLNVTASDHDSYNAVVAVDPGRTNNRVVNLSIQAIKVDWDVVETEVEDVYDIVTTVKYETQVPVPVVECILPKQLPMDEIRQNGSCLINAILTNRGLISADLVNFKFQPAQGFEFEYLVENGFALMPKQSLIIPVRVKLAQQQVAQSSEYISVKGDGGKLSCLLDAMVDWMWYCGPDRKSANAEFGMKAADCIGYVPHGSAGGGYIGGGGLGGPTGLGGGGYYGGSSGGGSVRASETDCDPCLNAKLKVITKCVVKQIPIVKTVLEFDEILSCVDLQCLVVKTVKKPKWLEKLVGYKEVYDCIRDLVKACDDISPKRAPSLKSTKAVANPYGENLPSYMVKYITALDKCNAVFEAKENMYLELMGDACWVDNIESDSERAIFSDAFNSWLENGRLDNQPLLDAKPAKITSLQMETLIDRWNNTMTGDFSSGNFVDQDKIDQYQQVFFDLNEECRAKGYTSVMEWFQDEQKTYEEAVKGNSGSVCSTVTLQINQTMTMTRQAFLGTLTVYNGHETKPMTDVKLTLEVTDEYGDLSTSHEFQINPTDLTGFTGELNLTKGWTLNPRETGVATIQFIPTKYAAPTQPVEYSFGGTLSYVNPYTGEKMVRELFPVKLVVKPSPVLDLTYFMQRDIMGDNPLTLDVVEPMIPSEFALLINNRGYGDATKVNVMTRQPKIIANEKNLLIDFEILSSQVNGKQKNLALGGSVGADFGTIPAHSTAYAQWMLQSSLMGHFIEYDVKATHVTSFGNKDLSLLNEVTIHELIHSIRVPSVGKEELVGFLVNDISDAFDLPDALYLSDGAVRNVVVLDKSLTTWKDTGEKNVRILNVLPEQSAWHYGWISDPTSGNAKLKKVVRMSDNKEIPLDNFWQTSYTLRDGKDPLQEYLIHFVDTVAVSTSGVDYRLEFEPFPDVVLAVEAFEGMDVEDDLFIKPVENVKFRFNKPVVASTFTVDDLHMICQGKPVDLSNVSLTSDDHRSYTINLGQTANRDGFYELTVHTNGIMDTENFYGRNGRSVDWIYFLDGLLRLRTEVYPKESGEVFIQSHEEAAPEQKTKNQIKTNPAAGTGEKLVGYNKPTTVTAKPAPGYRFKGWYLGDELVSTDEIFTTVCLDHTLLTAEFVPTSIQVVVKENEHGQILGAGDGKYDHGRTLTFTAVPNEGYALTGWLVNGSLQPANGNNKYTVQLSEDLVLEAVFSIVATGSFVGDVNNDGLISIYDVSLLCDYVLGKPVEDFHIENADVNGDGIVTIIDSSALLDLILMSK